MRILLVLCLMVLGGPAFAAKYNWKYAGKRENASAAQHSAGVAVGPSHLVVGYRYSKKDKRSGVWLILFRYKGNTKIEKFGKFTIFLNEKSGPQAIEQIIKLKQVRTTPTADGFAVSGLISYREVELIKAGHIIKAEYSGRRDGSSQPYSFKFPLNTRDGVGAKVIIANLEKELKGTGAAACCKPTGRPIPSKTNAEIAEVNKTIWSFKFPSDGCSSPANPFYMKDRPIKEKLKPYFACLDKADARDTVAVNRIVAEVGGTVIRSESVYRYVFPEAHRRALGNLVKLQEQRAVEREKDKRHWRSLTGGGSASGSRKPAPSEKQARIWKRIRHFEFPDSDCTWPGVSSTRASKSVVERSNRRKDEYRRCLENAHSQDQRAVYTLVRDVGGKVEKLGNGKIRYTNLPKGFKAPLDDIIAHKKRRSDRRVKRWEALQEAVRKRNAAVERAEFWGGLRASTDQMARDMERQRRQQMLQQPPVYVSPGYR